MPIYARVSDGIVVEFVETGNDISTMFHPSLRFVEVIADRVALGWQVIGTGFGPPSLDAEQPGAPTGGDVQCEQAGPADTETAAPAQG